MITITGSIHRLDIKDGYIILSEPGEYKVIGADKVKVLSADKSPDKYNVRIEGKGADVVVEGVRDCLIRGNVVSMTATDSNVVLEFTSQAVIARCHDSHIQAYGNGVIVTDNKGSIEYWGPVYEFQE